MDTLFILGEGGEFGLCELGKEDFWMFVLNLNGLEATYQWRRLAWAFEAVAPNVTPWIILQFIAEEEI